MTAMLTSTYVIAEAGVNHDGSIDHALRLVDVAVEAGADAVKFQVFRPDALVTRAAEKARYQTLTTGPSESQFQMLERLVLPHGDFLEIARHARAQGIEFLATAFDGESLDFLDTELQISRLKIASGEITNGPFLADHAERGRPLMLSTGMATLSEVEQALLVLAVAAAGRLTPGFDPSAGGDLWTEDLRDWVQREVTLLQCTTSYPAPAGDAHLRAMDTMRAAFGTRVGLSDHTEGAGVAIAAVARGAQVVEKHITLDRTMPGPDQAASMEPEDFARLVSGIRQAEEALGDPWKAPSAAERENRIPARRSLVALRVIEEGEAFTQANVGAKRPGSGMSPMRLWSMLGRPARRRFEPDEPIEP